MKFQVINGKHHVFAHGKDGTVSRVDSYVQGDIIKADQNLVGMWNSPGVEKFARVDDDEAVRCSRLDVRRPDGAARANLQAPPRVQPVRQFSKVPSADEIAADDTFSEMTKAQLQAVAEQNNIKLDGATRKGDIRAKVEEFAGA